MRVHEVDVSAEGDWSETAVVIGDVDDVLVERLTALVLQGVDWERRVARYFDQHHATLWGRPYCLGDTLDREAATTWLADVIRQVTAA